ncbi:MAG: DUF3748 domain-containing protein, partial [Flavitalea sp.]
DKWIVYDIRNEDGQIGQTGSIEMINISGTEIKELYHTEGQTAFGPGVGAVTFSPVADTVLFIHGIRNSDKENPYSMTRRTGVAIDLEKPLHPVFMDARDIMPPFTAGALRGGTHAHSWSGDGQWISFTYNDYIIERLGKLDSSIKDMRTIGVMAPFGKVRPDSGSVENNPGEKFSAVVVKVKQDPAPGSDDIDKACEECWIGVNGYARADGNIQRRAIAFQGNLRDEKGNLKTEVFVVDLPDNITRANTGQPLEGTTTSGPNVPYGVVQRRVSHTEWGITGPRHWLRTTPDGSLIGFLTKGSEDMIQLFGISPNGGAPRQITFQPFPIQGGFNFSPDGKQVIYSADNSIFLTTIATRKSERLAGPFSADAAPAGTPVWSNNGKMVAYNRYLTNKEGRFLQIFIINL